MPDVPEAQMVVFSPKDPKYTVSVFTDVDCAYCQQLHSQIAEYNRLGIKVRYLFYPRSGPNTESWAKAEEVWCSADRGKALTRAKRGEVAAHAEAAARRRSRGSTSWARTWVCAVRPPSCWRAARCCLGICRRRRWPPDSTSK